MNQLFLEMRAREKIRDLQAEGMANQAAHRAGAIGPGFLSRLRDALRRIVGRGGKQGDANLAMPQVGPLRVKPRT